MVDAANDKKVQELFTNATNWDPDIRIMAANDLTDLIDQEKIQKKDQVLEILLTQLNDKITEVQGNSIRNMSRIMKKLDIKQIELVSKKLIDLVSGTQGAQAEFRDVYSTCIKTLINDIPRDFNSAIQPVVTSCIQGIKKLQGEKQYEIVEELIDIMSTVFKKWASSLVNCTTHQEKKELSDILVNFILNGNRPTIKKRSCNCLGTIAPILNQEINDIVGGQLLNVLKGINPQQIKQQDTKEHVYIIELAINSICKSASSKLSELVIKNLLQYILAKSKQLIDLINNDDKDNDDVIFVTDILELYLLTIDSIVKTNLKIDQIEAIKKLIISLSSFDPYGKVKYIRESQMQAEEAGSDNSDWEEDPDDEDSSWKVRKGALQVLETLLKTYVNSQQIIEYIYNNLIYQSNQQQSNDDVRIVKRLGESNDAIRSQTITLLNTFLKAITILDLPTSQTEDDQTDLLIMPQVLVRQDSRFNLDVNLLVKQVTIEIDLIFKDKKTTDFVKIQSFKLIEQICKTVNKTIVQSFESYYSVFSPLQKIFQISSCSNEFKVIALTSLKRLFRWHGDIKDRIKHIANSIPDVIEIAKQNLNHEFFKISAEAIKLLNCIFQLIIKNFPQLINQYQPLINQCIPLIQAKLKQGDVDQEIKQAIIACTASVFKDIGNTLQSSDLNILFENLLERLDVDLRNQILVLRVVKLIPNDLFKLDNQPDQRSIKLLNESLGRIESYLQKNDRTMRLASLEAINNIVFILTNKNRNLLQPQICARIVKGLFSFFKETDIILLHITLKILKNITSVILNQQNAQSNPQIKEIQEKCIALSQNQSIQGMQLDFLYEIFNIIASTNFIDNEATITQLLQQINKDCLESVSKTISSIIFASKQQTKDKFIQLFAKDMINSQIEELRRQIALKSIGEIGKKIDLTNNNQIFNGVLSLISNKQEQLEGIRLFACTALGGIALGNVDKSLVIIIELAKQGKEGYLMLNTLKMMLNTVKDFIQNNNQSNANQAIIKHLSDRSDDILAFLFDLSSQKNYDDSLRNINAECIGIMCSISLQKVKQKIRVNLGSQNISTRHTSALSFKYFCHKGLPINSDLQELVQDLIKNMLEEDQPTRAAVLNSLNMIAFSLPNAMQEQATKEKFFSPLRPSLKYRQDLIRTVELGPMKHQIDDGLNVRSAAFSLLDTTLHFKHTATYVNEVILAVVEDLELENDVDILITKLHILNKLVQKLPIQFIQVLSPLQQKLFTLLKQHASKKTIDSDRAKESVIQNLLLWSHLHETAVDQNCAEFLNNYELVKKTGVFKPIIDSLVIQ